jgi:hypothetical protein
MKRLVVVTVALGAAVLLTACTQSTHSANGGSLAGGAPDAAKAAPPAAAGAAHAGSAAGTESTALDQAPLASTALIKKASLQVQIGKPGQVGAQADAAGQIAAAAEGSVFADQRTSGERPSAELTLKVPPDSLTAVLSRLAALGKELSRQSSSQDVTSQVADVSSRVQSARDSLIRLRVLYTHASKIGDVIAIESEIAQREADLESLEAQQRTLAAQTSMATIELTLSTSTTPAPAAKHNDKTGFVGGLQRGWHAFGTSVVAVATALAAALPFLVLLALIGWGALAMRRRTRAAAPPTPAPGDAA